MEPKVPDCCCSGTETGEAVLPVHGGSSRLPRQLAVLAVALVGWWILYRSLLPSPAG